MSLVAEAAPPAEHALSRRLAAEAIGSFFLFAGVLGSGVMAQNLMDGNVAVALLANTIATGAILYVLIAMLGPISDAHFNPAVSIAFALRGETRVRIALTILVTLKRLPGSVPASVALYITAAYWFTSSTSFANPAITVVRSLSDTFAGIAPVDVPGFIAAQLVGMMLAVGVGGWLSADPPTGEAG